MFCAPRKLPIMPCHARPFLRSGGTDLDGVVLRWFCSSRACCTPRSFCLYHRIPIISLPSTYGNGHVPAEDAACAEIRLLEGGWNLDSAICG